MMGSFLAGSTEAAGAYDEEKVGADIVKRALSYPLKLIAKNAGINGSVVSEKSCTIMAAMVWTLKVDPAGKFAWNGQHL
ncbi:hypothetical protein Pyn_09347 [Prunus yedoensis var. nudiflora]|uniref:Uncharacterized protein n=1 Tax=Prunus yedoensis var. nudiflora TaxID=2094558 RepID=A0A314UWA1_PRUYE|nr:hypothetical protein Pyn_09347 [Prunus yedoensis var. nudiflora]